MRRCTHAPKHWCTHTPMHPCTLDTSTDARMHRCTDVPMHSRTDASMHPSNDATMHPCTVAPMHQCTVAQMHKLKNLHFSLIYAMTKFVRWNTIIRRTYWKYYEKCTKMTKNRFFRKKPYVDAFFLKKNVILLILRRKAFDWEVQDPKQTPERNCYEG